MGWGDRRCFGGRETGGIAEKATVERADKACAFHLYVDPRERRPMVIRKTWLAPILGKIRVEHLATFQDYPAKKPVVERR